MIINLDHPLKERHVQDVLRELLPNDHHGPSEMGWSKLSLPMLCWYAARLRLIEKWRPINPRMGIDIGTLGHLCEHWAYTKAKTYEEIGAFIDEVGKRCPKVADEVRRVLYEPQEDGLRYFPEVVDEDLKKWPVVGSEMDAAFKLRPRPHPADLTKLEPVTTRFDQVFRHPDGDGVFIKENKFVARLESDYVRGFGMNGQILLQALIWQKSGLAKQHGPLRHFLINLHIKTKTPKLVRTEVVVRDEEIKRFWKNTKPWAEALHFHLSHSAKREKTWPRNYAGCKAGFLCEFYDWCEGGVKEGLYETEP